MNRLTLITMAIGTGLVYKKNALGSGERVGERKDKQKTHRMQ